MFVEHIDGMITEYFCRGVVKSIYRNEKGTPLTINYRDGRKITHNSIPYYVIYIRMSFDGKLLYTGDVNIALRCYDSETMELLWENKDIACRVIVAEDGVIGIESQEETTFQHINDGSLNGIVEKGHQCKRYLVKLNSKDGRVKYRIECNGDIEDLTHDHLIACLDGENYSILRKSDLTVIDRIPGGKIKNFCWMYVKDGKLHTYYKVLNPYAVNFCEETLIDFTLSNEVQKTEEKYKFEIEEQLRIMKYLIPIIDPQDVRLTGMFDAEGNILNRELLDKYRLLCLIDHDNRDITFCTMCGNIMDDGYSSFDSSKLICRKCYNDFKRMMHFNYVKKLTDISGAVQRIEETTAKYKRIECGFDAIQPLFYYIRLERAGSIMYYKTFIFNNRILYQFRLEDCAEREKYDDVKLTLYGYNYDEPQICYEIYLRANERGGDKCFVYKPLFEKIYNNDVYKALIRKFTDELDENPFTDVLTDYEIITTGANYSFIGNLLSILAESMQEYGESRVIISKTYEGLSGFYVYDISNASEITNELIYAASFVILSEEKRFAVIHSCYGFSITGGTQEFMETFRKVMMNYGTIGTSDFVRNFRLRKKDMSTFYKMKRNLVTWVTKFKDSSEGLYEILHAHMFSSSNRKLIEGTTKCGCFFCLKQCFGTDIKEWTDGKSGKTALCPHCSNESLIPETCGHPINNDFLTKMNSYWFNCTRFIRITHELWVYEPNYSFVLLDAHALSITLNQKRCFLDGRYLLCLNHSDVIENVSGNYSVWNLAFMPYIFNINSNFDIYSQSICGADKLRFSNLYLFRLRNEKYIGVIPLSADEYETVELYFKRVERYYEKRFENDTMWACKVRTDMFSILNIAENAYLGKKSSEGNEIIRFIKDNVGSALTLTGLCEHFHMSRTTLAKITKELTGLSPMAFLLEERLTQVLPDLLFTSIPISELAEMYGFSEVNYFIRAFKKKYDKSPLQYRIEGRAVLQ